MLVQGINADRYMVNNPTWVECSNIDPNTNYILVTAEPLSIIPLAGVISMRLYPRGGSGQEVYFDFSKVVKTFFPLPNHPTTTMTNGQTINTNYQRVTLTLEEYDIDDVQISSQNFIRTFIRAGVEKYKTNVPMAVGQVLNPSLKIPVWNGYPYWKYSIDSNNSIIAENIIPPTEIERRRNPTCTPLYFRFLNNLGGYSFWLFEKWNITKKNDSQEVIERRLENVSLGANSEYSLTVETRVERRHYALMRSLVDSSEVAIYDGAETLLNTPSINTFVAIQWLKVFGKGNSIKLNNADDVSEVSFNFDVKLTLQTTTIW